MIYQKHIPTFPLNKYIDNILYLSGNNKGAGLPKTAMSIVFNLNDAFKLFTDNSFTTYIDYKKYWLAGLQTKPNFVESYGQSEMVIIQFKTIGTSVFLDHPLHLFTDSYIPLDDIFHQLAEETWEQLMESKTYEGKFAITEKFLYQIMKHLPIQKFDLISSIDCLLRKNEFISIHHICQHYQISRKHLTYLFKTHSGVSPKLLSSLFRLQRTLQSFSQGRLSKLTDLAYQEAYFDQAHFINDFKTFTGLAPSAYATLMAATPSMKIFPHFLPKEAEVTFLQF